MQQQGIPTLTLTTTEFVNLAHVEARGLRIPNLPILTVEHPIAGLPRDAVRAKVDRIAGAIGETLKLAPRKPA
ncbi:MAG: hypothetical protein AAB502_09020 [Chloroflexota bacterium]